MFAGIRFINGYSPIRPAGVAREFDSAIHGEIAPDKAAALLRDECGADGLLAKLGVDGIIVANEMELVPEPATEWHLVRATSEGRVFHRWESLPAVRSLNSIDSRPNEQFATADVSGVTSGRNRLETEVVVPAEGKPALLVISRPYFDGYRAKINGRSVAVESYRGLMPLIELPAGATGRLTITYRPWWLIWGGAVAAASATALLGFTVLAAIRSRPA